MCDGECFTEEEERVVIDTMHKHAGEDCAILVRYAYKLVNRANGKNLFFLNEKVSVSS